MLIVFGEAFGMLIGTSSQSDKIVTSIIPFFYAPIFGMAGYFANIDHIHPVVRWMQYISPLRYAFEIFLRTEFDDNPKYKFNVNKIYGLNFGVTN